MKRATAPVLEPIAARLGVSIAHRLYRRRSRRRQGGAVDARPRSWSCRRIRRISATWCIEAMAAGCPVIVSQEVGLADTVRATGAGLVVDGDAGHARRARSPRCSAMPRCAEAMGERDGPPRISATRGRSWPRRWKTLYSLAATPAGRARMNNITGLVLTFNEAPNIARTLGKLLAARTSWWSTAQHRWHAGDRRRISERQGGRAAFHDACGAVEFRTRGHRHHDRVGAGARRRLRADRRAWSRRSSRLHPDAVRRRLLGVVHVLHRRPAAARRGLSAGHRAVSPSRGRYEQDGHTQRDSARRRRGRLDGADACTTIASR